MIIRILYMINVQNKPSFVTFRFGLLAAKTLYTKETRKGFTQLRNNKTNITKIDN